MLIEREQDVTPAVLAVMERTSDPRLREIMISLVKHLHGFVREVRLTEAEFRDATAILNEIGQARQRHPQRDRADGGLARRLVAGLPAQQRRQRQHRDVAVAARAVLAAELAARREWRLDRPLATRPGDPLFVSARVQDRRGRADRRRRGRRLARLAGRPLREPGSRAGRDEPARQVHHRCRRAASGSAP